MAISFVKKDRVILRSLSANPKEARSLGELSELTGLKPAELVERLQALGKHYTIIEANGKFCRSYIPELDGEKKTGAPVSSAGIEYRQEVKA